MQSERLRESLEQLRAEINAANLGEGPAKERLNGLIGDIERRIDDPEEQEPDPAEHASLVENIKDSIHQLEVEHPRATSILNQIMAALGGVGI